MNCYFINYKVFVNIVKYKLDLMQKKMETSERDATNRSSFKCTGKYLSRLDTINNKQKKKFTFYFY